MKSGTDPEFRKVRDAAHADVFAAEAEGLEALRLAGVRVPRVLDHGLHGGNAFISLERLDLQRGGDWKAMARMLAKMHRAHGPRFGWHRDNYIGDTPQPNAWCDNWAEFWMTRRLQPQAELARRNGFSFDLSSLGKLLEGHAPEPSLLHGDLWSGNAGFTPEGPVIYDPAVYYGDREADLAMTELFGGFPREFYAAYEAELPLPDGHAARKPLYNLYHLLNHLNLFGRGYLGQVEAALGLLRDSLQ